MTARLAARRARHRRRRPFGGISFTNSGEKLGTGPNVAIGRTVIFLIAVVGLGLNAWAFPLLAVNGRTLHRRCGENLPRENQPR